MRISSAARRFGEAFRSLAVLAACLVPITVPSPSIAQGYPTKSIRIVVPYATGGSTDIVARIIAPHMTEILGATVYVENKAGAGSVIGVDAVAKAAPDGYTLGIVNIAFVANPSLKKQLPYNTEKDLLPVSLITTSTLVLAANTSVPANNLKDFIALAKSKPDGLFYGSAGVGTGSHLMVERFNHAAGIKMVHVPFKGGGPAVLALVGGETSLYLASVPSTLQYFQSKKLVPLAVGSLKRNPALPDVPTISEAALPGFDATEWVGLVAPAGTPRAIVERLYQALAKVLAMPSVNARLVEMGADPVGSSPSEFSTFINKETGVWAKVIKDVGITAE